MLKRTLLASSVIAALLGACGGNSDDDADFEDAGLSLAEVPAAYASVFCDVITRCDPFFDAYIPKDDCEDYFISTLNAQGFDDVVAAVEDDRATYHPDKMKQCLDEISARSCDELDDPDPESCEEATVGTVARGGDCTTDIECEGVSICQFAGSCPGTCSAKLSAGESCDGDDDCQEGLECSDDTDQCVEPAQEGEDCDGGVAPPCASDRLYCLGDDEEEDTPGKCRQVEDLFVAEPGDECSFDVGPLCKEGSACVIVGANPLAFECAEVADAGEECHFGYPNPCQPGSHCGDIDLVAADLDGTCEPNADPGDECDLATPFMCGLGTVCTANDTGARCVAKKDNGVTCESSDECWSENCVDGGCAPESACHD